MTTLTTCYGRIAHCLCREKILPIAIFLLSLRQNRKDCDASHERRPAAPGHHARSNQAQPTPPRRVGRLRRHGAVYGDPVRRGTAARLRTLRGRHTGTAGHRRVPPPGTIGAGPRHPHRRAAEDTRLLSAGGAVAGRPHARPPAPAALCSPAPAPEETAGPGHRRLHGRLQPRLVAPNRTNSPNSTSTSTTATTATTAHG